MGWLWSSTPSKLPSAPSTSPPQAPPTTLPPALPTPSPTEPISKPRTLTPDEQADEEFAQLIRDLSSDTASSSPNSKPPKPSKLKFHPTTSEPLDPSSDNSPADDSLYPSTMSCSAAFDSAFYCQSLGGKFNDIYRYGELRSCSEHWSAFWFCMRQKSVGDGERRRKVQEHYRERAAKYKTMKSSEDVWEVRRTPLQEAFKGFEGVDGM